jgi:hypothetical protein
MRLLLLLPLFLTSCDILEGMRQSDPNYIPRSERRELKKALKDWKEGRADFNKQFPELAELNLP